MRVLKQVLIGIGTMAAFLAVGYFALIVIVMSMWGSDHTRDRTRDWPQYYRETVSAYFTLPPEIVVVSAVHTDTGIMGDRWTVKFRLPDTQTPEAWLAKIARDSGMKPSYHQARFLYDCDDRSRDTWRMEYQPAERLYVAQGSWD